MKTMNHKINHNERIEIDKEFDDEEEFDEKLDDEEEFDEEVVHHDMIIVITP